MKLFDQILGLALVGVLLLMWVTVPPMGAVMTGSYIVATLAGVVAAGCWLKFVSESEY